jgi:hypothetical protein
MFSNLEDPFSIEKKTLQLEPHKSDIEVGVQLLSRLDGLDGFMATKPGDLTNGNA